MDEKWEKLVTESMSDDARARMDELDRSPHASKYYDPDGNPISMGDWCGLFEARKNYRAKTSWWKLGEDSIGESRVSTVWLGLDHNFGGGRPLIFETLVFDGPLDGEMDRYSTKEEALAGHRAMVERVKNGE